MKRIFAVLAALGLIFFGARSQVLNTVEAPYIIADTAFQGPGSGITGFAPGLTTGDSTAIFAALASTASGQGAALVGENLGITGEVSTTQHEINSETISVFRFLTAAQIADVRAGTATFDLATPLQTACTYLSTFTTFKPRRAFSGSPARMH